MTTTDPDNSTEENVIAYAAVTLCGNPSKGAIPQWHELAAWRRGTLDSQRSAEVLSHVANDPACFQQWLDIAEAESWVEENAESAGESYQADAITGRAASVVSSAGASDDSASVNSLVSNTIKAIRGFFQQSLPVYAGASAAVILAVLVVPLLRTGDALSLQQQLDRSTDAYIVAGNGLAGTPPVARSTRSLAGLFDDLSVIDVEQLHLQAGLQRFYEKLRATEGAPPPVSDAWQDLLAELPTDIVDCTKALDPTHCTTVANDVQLLGQWSLMNATACDTLATQDAQLVTADFWTEQHAMYENIRSLPGLTGSTMFAALLSPVETQTPNALCAIANSVIAAGR